MSDGYLGSGKLIIQAIKKYGRQNFKRIILQTAETRQQANNVQKHYIKLFNAQQSGYNIHQGGLGFSSELNPQKLDPKFGERNPFLENIILNRLKIKLKRLKEIMVDPLEKEIQCLVGNTLNRLNREFRL